MDDLLDNDNVLGLLVLFGFLFAAASLAVGVTAVVQGFQDSSKDAAGSVGAAVCMLASTGLGVAISRYSYRRLGEDKTGDDPEPDARELESQLLEVAEAHDGQVTVAMVAANTDLTLADADSMLTRLAEKGLARLDIDVDGNTVYVFPGLDSSTQVTFDADQFEQQVAEARAEQAAATDSES